MNEEATMSRKGLDPVSRKTKTPGGRKKSGFCVYLAYQLLDSVTVDQMVGECVNKHVDLGYKKKQLLGIVTKRIITTFGHKHFMQKFITKFVVFHTKKLFFTIAS